MIKVKVQAVRADDVRQVFEVVIEDRVYEFPYSTLDPAPTQDNPVVLAQVDTDVGGEGFAYTLASGEEGGAMGEHVLSYNDDPRIACEEFLHQLNVEALSRFHAGGFTKRGLASQLGTSATQVDRLLDVKNTRKSVESMVGLVTALGGTVDLGFD